MELAREIPLRSAIARLICANCERFDGIDASVESLANKNYKDAVLHLSVASPDRVHYLDSWSRFCDADRCAFMTPSRELLFFDSNHLSMLGAKHLFNNLDALLGDTDLTAAGWQGHHTCGTLCSKKSMSDR
jgi:hypothetical protein